MPAGIAGVVQVWEAHREGPEVRARTPAAASDKLVESRMQYRRIHRFPERLLPVITKPDDRPCPAFFVMRIASDIAPKHSAPLIGKLPRKGLVQSDKPVLNKLL